MRKKCISVDTFIRNKERKKERERGREGGREEGRKEKQGEDHILILRN